MDRVAQLSEELQWLLTDVAYEAGRSSGFIKRERRLNGATFVQTMTFGWLASPQASLGELNQAAANVGVTITPQGLHGRFTAEAAACLAQVLAEALQQVMQYGDRERLPLLARFAGVYLTDSSVIGLPKTLAADWPGCGGGQGPTAALKLQVRWNMADGQLTDMLLRPGNEHDRRGAQWFSALPAGALQLEDLGYFKLDALQASAAAGVIWLTRFKTHTVVYTAAGERLNLAEWLPQQPEDTLDVPIQLGSHHRLPCRLVARRLSPTEAAKRRRQLKRAARKRGQTLSQARLALADWDLYVTNALPDLLSTDEVLVLVRVRWQIELLFKLWKSEGGLRSFTSQHPWRVLCEVYAKLLAVVIQHWLCLTAQWAFPSRSLHKAAQTIRKHAFHLACVLGDTERLRQALEVIKRCLMAGCRLDTRRQQPSTAQLLLEFA